MGLPIWRVPEDEQPKDAIKNDPTARTRSPIRRRPSPPHPRRGVSLDLPHNDIPRLSNTWAFPTASPEPLDDSTLGVNVRLVPRLYREQTQLPSISQVIEGRETSTDVRRLRLPPAPELPTTEPEATEPRVRFGSADLTARERHVPYTSNFAPARRVQVSDTGALAGSRRIAHWRGYPIMRPLPDQWVAYNQWHDDAMRQDELYRREYLASRGYQETDPSFSMEVPRTERSVDGLGDRNRSPSPAAHTQWDNMLNTITPDERLPSTDSGLTSTVASQSFSSSSTNSNTNSLTSSRTSVDALPTDYDDEQCELVNIWDVAVESEDGDSSTRPTHLFDPQERSERPQSRRSTGLAPPTRATVQDLSAFVRGFLALDRPRTSETQQQRGSRSPPAVHRSIIDGPLVEAPSGAQHSGQALALLRSRNTSRDATREATPNIQVDQPPNHIDQADLLRNINDDGDDSQRTREYVMHWELRQMRAVMERLSRHEAIPEEWWVSVGLTHAIQPRSRR